MPQIEQPKSQWRRVSAITALVLVVLAAGGYTAYRFFPSPATVMAHAKQLDEAGSFQTAYSELKKAYGRAVFGNDKDLLLQALGMEATNVGDLPGALHYYRLYHDRHPNDFHNLLEMANTAYAMGDKTDAIDYYRQALAVLQNGQYSDPTNLMAKNLQENITNLSGSGK